MLLYYNVMLLSVSTKQCCFDFDTQVYPLKESKFDKNGPLSGCLWNERRCLFAAHKERKNKKPLLKLIPPQRVDMSHITRSQP